MANAVEELIARYEKSCEQKRCDPIKPLLSLLEKEQPTKQNTENIHSLLLRGSQPELFHERVSYNQLDALTETFKGVCSMHTLDLSYNFIDDTGAKLIANFLKVGSLRSSYILILRSKL